MMIHLTWLYNLGNTKYVYRGCLYNANEHPVYKVGECFEADYGYSKIKVCACDQDKCNDI